MSDVEDRESVTVGALPEAVGVARAFVGRVVGPSHPCAQVAVLLASELVTKGVLYSGSAVAGGLVTVTVAAWEGGVRVEVADRSGPGRGRRAPDARPHRPPAPRHRNGRPWPATPARWRRPLRSERRAPSTWPS